MVFDFFEELDFLDLVDFADYAAGNEEIYDDEEYTAEHKEVLGDVGHIDEYRGISDDMEYMTEHKDILDDMEFTAAPLAALENAEYAIEPLYSSDYSEYVNETSKALNNNGFMPKPAEIFNMPMPMSINKAYYTENMYNSSAYSDLLQQVHDNSLSENSLYNEYINGRRDFITENEYLYNYGKDSNISAFIEGIVTERNFRTDNDFLFDRDFLAGSENAIDLPESLTEAIIENNEVSFISEHSTILDRINNEDKELIKETERSLQEINTVNERAGQSIGVSPVFNITFGDVRETADINAICSKIRDVIADELMASCEGVY